MFKLLAFVLLLFTFQGVAKEVTDIGKVKAYFRAGNIWTGVPTMAYLEVINEVTYAYYIIPDTTSPLLKQVGKVVEFRGRIWKDSTTIKDGGLPHWFIKVLDFEIKK